jgi:hypothetical protein
MQKRRFVAAMGIPISLLLFGCSSAPPVSYWKTAEPPQRAAYSDEQAYTSKVDFARLEHELPLSVDDLKQITFRNLQAADQEQLNQIYSRLTAGSIPNGAYKGEFFFPQGESGRRRIAEIMGQNLKGVMVNFKMAKVEHLGDAMWRGKVFDREKRISRSRMSELVALKDIFGEGAGEATLTTVNGRQMRLAFPAKVYCGQSLLDGRRESIVLDYAFSDDIEGYRKKPDALAGRDGFMLREELRMVRPGLYLGRAYMGRMLAANFVLVNEDPEQETAQTKEDCFVGAQRMAADRHGS